jgi:hypothetical protein
VNCINKKLIVTTIILIGAAIIPLSLGDQSTTEQNQFFDVNNSNLTAEIIAPDTWYVNAPIEFDAQASGGEAPYDYEWDFGDGSEANFLRSPTHTYTDIGTYTITLTVTDDALYEEQEVNVTETIVIEDEEVNPQVNILQPNQALYINNNELLPMQNTFIIGNITVKADAVDEESGIKNVTFSLNGEFQEEIIIPPYNWKWDTVGFGKYTLTVTAYDYTENMASKEIVVYKLF